MAQGTTGNKPVVGIAFHSVGKVHYYDPGSLAVVPGDPVIAETFRGVELGRAVTAPRDVPSGMESGKPPKLLRKASKGDLSTSYRNRLRAAEALRTAEQTVKDHGLPMKLLDAEYTLDGNRIVIYFSSEGRVDFRGLVRDLASSLRKRIELHQVGARDRAKLTGAMGPCGRECCCSSWLRVFSPVSIKMTKEQGLSLNPAKISGSCGRLMCCLRYEYETYRRLRQELPSPGSEVELPEGRARVLEVHLLRQTLTVQHPELGVFDVPAGRALVEDQSSKCNSCSRDVCEPAEVRERSAEDSSLTQGDARPRGPRGKRRRR